MVLIVCHFQTVSHPELRDWKDDPKFIARQKFTDVPHKETHITHSPSYLKKSGKVKRPYVFGL